MLGEKNTPDCLEFILDIHDVSHKGSFLGKLKEFVGKFEFLSLGYLLLGVKAFDQLLEAFELL